MCCMENSFYACSHSLIAFGLCYFLYRVFKTQKFFDVSSDEKDTIYTLNINRGRFQTPQSFNSGYRAPESFKIHFRHVDVKNVSEGIYIITQKLKENDCPNIFGKYQSMHFPVSHAEPTRV